MSHHGSRVRLVGLLLGAALLAACAGNSGAGTGGTVAGGTTAGGTAAGVTAAQKTQDAATSLTVVLGAEPKGWDVHVNENGPLFTILFGNTYEGLTLLNPSTGAVEPLLATQWRMEDRLRWRFTLRENVRFSDGEPFTAAAVVKNVQRLVDPATGTELSGYIKGIVRAEQVDDLTVDIITDGPDPILPKRMYFVMMVAPGALSGGGWPEPPPAGTGPYVVQSIRKGSSATLVRNDGYWGGRPAIAAVTWLWNANAEERLRLLRSGQAHIVKDVPVETLNQAPRVVSVAGNETGMLRLNGKRALTADVRVRRAIQMAINRQAILDDIWKGYAVPANGQPTPEGSFGYDRNITDYPYDPAGARALLREAGAEGATVDIVMPAGRYPKAEAVVRAVARDLQAIGLRADVKVLSYDDWLTQLFITGPEGASALFVATSNELYDADTPMVGYIHSQANKAIPPAGPDTVEMDRLIDTARHNLDLRERQLQYQTVFRRLYERADIVTLYRNQFIWGTQPNIDFQPRGDDWVLVRQITLR